MNKSVLVIETPETCHGCPLCVARVKKDKLIYFCNIPKCAGVDEVIRGVPNAEISKPDWCPLTPLPEHKNLALYVNGDMNIFQYNYAQGFNDCLDQIQKGTEK